MHLALFCRQRLALAAAAADGFAAELGGRIILDARRIGRYGLDIFDRKGGSDFVAVRRNLIGLA